MEKTLRRSHDRSVDQPALHLVSAFATTNGLVLGQEGVPDKSNELAAIPLLLKRLAADGGLRGSVVTIDAIACNGTIAAGIRNGGAEYLLAVTANQPSLRRDAQAAFQTACSIDRFTSLDKAHGRIEQGTSRGCATLIGSTATDASLTNSDCQTSKPS